MHYAARGGHEEAWHGGGVGRGDQFSEPWADHRKDCTATKTAVGGYGIIGVFLK